jgi:mono/diheme cytochrome c family protein
LAQSAVLTDIATHFISPDSIMPHTQRLLGLSLLIGLISACAGETKPAPDAAAQAATTVATAEESPMAKGEKTYTQICASCHQASGEGVTGNFPPLKQSKWLLGDARVPISIVLHGLQGEVAVNGQPYNGAMQPWSMLGDEDVANVLTYARATWGNSASPVTAAEVKTIRDGAQARGAWTAAELKRVYPGAGE